MMKMRRWIPAVLAATLLAGCTNPLSKDNKEVVTQKGGEESSTIIPNTKTDGQYYRTLLPYKKSASRGLIVSNIYSS
ncbi:MAG TPA: CamS family sex pheromone protein, partial [Kurthia sp.]